MSNKKKTSSLWGRRAHGVSGVVAKWELRPVQGSLQNHFVLASPFQESFVIARQRDSIIGCTSRLFIPA